MKNFSELSGDQAIAVLFLSEHVKGRYSEEKAEPASAHYDCLEVAVEMSKRWPPAIFKAFMHMARNPNLYFSKMALAKIGGGTFNQVMAWWTALMNHSVKGKRLGSGEPCEVQLFRRGKECRGRNRKKFGHGVELGGITLLLAGKVGANPDLMSAATLASANAKSHATSTADMHGALLVIARAPELSEEQRVAPRALVDSHLKKNSVEGLPLFRAANEDAE